MWEEEPVLMSVLVALRNEADNYSTGWEEGHFGWNLTGDQVKAWIDENPGTGLFHVVLASKRRPLEVEVK